MTQKKHSQDKRVKQKEQQKSDRNTANHIYTFVFFY